MALTNTANATKTLKDAKPFANEAGLVQKWSITVEYELNDYKSSFNQNIDAGDTTFAPAAVDTFTQAQLLALFKNERPDNVFEAQYTSVKVNPPVAQPKAVHGFDIKNLK